MRGKEMQRNVDPGAVFTAAARVGWDLLSLVRREASANATRLPRGYAGQPVADLLQSSCSVYSAAASTPRNPQPCETRREQQQARWLRNSRRAAVHEYRAAICCRLEIRCRGVALIQESDDVRPKRQTGAYVLERRHVGVRGALESRSPEIDLVHEKAGGTGVERLRCGQKCSNRIGRLGARNR